MSIKPTEVFDDREICFEGNNKNSDFDFDEYSQNLIKGLVTNNIAKDIIIYPNPTQNEITLSHFSNEEGEFILMNALEQIVFKTKLQKQVYYQNIDLPEILPAGLYHYQCLYNGQENYLGKLIIAK